MAKFKVKKQSTAIDMTPMVDLAFLLITFFMLTIQFKPAEAVEIATPKSISKKETPKDSLIQISISKEGYVFLSVSEKMEREPINDAERVTLSNRTNWLERMSRQSNVKFSDSEKAKFRLQSALPSDLPTLKNILSKDGSALTDAFKATKGIPVDSTEKNPFELALRAARQEEPDFRLVLKADALTPYPVVRDVIESMKRVRANKFNMITVQEADPRAPVAAPKSN